MSSELARVEVVRACRRINPATLPEATALLAGLDLIPLSGAVIDEAANVEGTMLRSPDAIHLASALSIQAELSAFVAYDHRLAAVQLGGRVVTVLVIATWDHDLAAVCSDPRLRYATASSGVLASIARR